MKSKKNYLLFLMKTPISKVSYLFTGKSKCGNIFYFIHYKFPLGRKLSK